jgi:hypothetical protein
MHEMGLRCCEATGAAGRRGASTSMVSLLGVALAACAALPPSFAELTWADQWGDRGHGVLERDFVMCSDLVESRRSQLSSCMSARGWSLGP